MDVWCGDYERHGGQVYGDDGGDMGHVVMVLSGDGRYRVLSVAQEPGVSPDPAWIDRHFSDRAAAEINSGGGPLASMPDNRALLSFGCAPGAKGSVVPLPGGQGATWAFPCRSA